MSKAVQISVNTRRLDWPSYLSLEIYAGETTLAELRAAYPEVLSPTHQLYCSTQERAWWRLKETELLLPDASYHLQAEISDELRRSTPLRCKACGKVSDHFDALRYHPGQLVPHAWNYTTHTWEWLCCSRLVSYRAVEAFITSDGCQVGLCAECRDLSAYQAAIKQHDREVESL